MKLLDSRRLTGANLLLPCPGAAIDVALENDRAGAAIDAWRRHARFLLEELGWWRPDALATRTYRGGATLAMRAPIDGLYAACEVNEAAWAAACRESGAAPHQAPGLDRLRELVAEETSPPLVALAAEAERRGVAFLSDDDEVSVGLGVGCRRWPASSIPQPTAVDWDEVRDVPAALVTGTNGKTTTVRMLAAIAAAAGFQAGNTSTDGVQIDGATVLAGDYTGGEGARTLLRDPRLEMALLEIARGGLLRRGLPIERVDAAAVTNVGHDHLGEYGIHDLDDLAAVKLLVAHAVARGGRLIVNADDAVLARRAATLDRDVIWIGCERPLAELAYAARDGALGPVTDGELQRWVELENVPAAVGGAAVHNVANALTALALADTLEIPRDAIAAGLARFVSDAATNPGRGNLFEFGGLRAFADFAHNPEGLARVMQMATRLRPQRLLVILGQAGDRDDAAIDDLADIAWEARPDRIVLKRMPRFLRGRAEGEVVGRLRDRLAQLGAPDEIVAEAPSEADAVLDALRWGASGDLLLLLLHERNTALPLLERLQAQSWQPGQPIPEQPNEEAQ